MKNKLTSEEISKNLKDLSKDWELKEGHLVRKYKLDDFKTALFITVKIGGIAEQMSHHPIITLSWGEVEVELWTHEVGGLTEKDFKLASSVDQIRLQ